MTAETISLGGGDGGFAAVDALVALMILATTLTLGLGAVQTARRAAMAADETRQATQILRGLLDAPATELGVVNGKSTSFQWRVATRLAAGLPNPTGAAICQRSASATAIRSARIYALATAEICPPQHPS